MQTSDPSCKPPTAEDIAQRPAAATSLISVAVTVQSPEPGPRAADLSGRPEGGVQSDPENQPAKSAKSRSRFSSAIRKLGKSSSRKKKELPAAEPPEFVVSSGAEDIGEVDPKGKKKKRGFLGFGKSKSKKAEEQPDEAKGGEQKEKEAEEKLAGERSPERKASPKGPITKVQIKISGKKVEPAPAAVASSKGWSPESPKSQPSDPDYVEPRPVAGELAATSGNTASPQTVGSSSGGAQVSDAKQTPASQSPPPCPAKSTVVATTTTKRIVKSTSTTEEKFVITESTRDTPPPDRAPDKPSRAAASVAATATTEATPTPSKATTETTTPTKATTTTPTAIKATTATSTAATTSTTAPKTATTAATPATKTTTATTPATATTPQQSSQAATGTGAVRKSKSRAAVAAPSILQRLKSGGAKKQRAAEKAAAAAAAAAATPTKAPKASPDLMQEAPTSTQRGHRFPKPAPPATATATQGNPTPPPSSAKPQEEPPAEAQIQLPLQSHESASSASRQQPQIAATHPPTTAQSTVADISSAVTPEIRSSPTRGGSPSLNITGSGSNSGQPSLAEELAASQRAASSSVAIHSAKKADEQLASSAESANPSEYLSPRYRNPATASKPLAVTATATFAHHLTPAPVQFAVGSPVRPQPISFESLQEQQSSDSAKTDSESQSPFVELSRRRILHYVEEPTFNDDDEDEDSLDRSLAALVYRRSSDLSPKESEEETAKQMPAFGDLTMDQEMEPAIMTASTAEKREHLYKILVIGELGTGKTSFIKRYVHQFFSQNYRATIGVDFALKVLHWDANTIVRLQLWDIAGQERFGNMTRVYYKEAVGAFIVFDVTRSGTFDCVAKWKEDLDSKVQLPDGSPIPCILLANKCDQEKQGIVTSPDKMDEYVKENGFAGWFETSAKENINIDEAAKALVNKILLNDKLIDDLSDGDKFNLNNSADQSEAEAKSKCSC